VLGRCSHHRRRPGSALSSMSGVLSSMRIRGWWALVLCRVCHLWVTLGCCLWVVGFIRGGCTSFMASTPFVGGGTGSSLPFIGDGAGPWCMVVWALVRRSSVVVVGPHRRSCTLAWDLARHLWVVLPRFGFRVPWCVGAPRRGPHRHLRVRVVGRHSCLPALVIVHGCLLVVVTVCAMFDVFAGARRCSWVPVGGHRHLCLLWWLWATDLCGGSY